MNIFCDRFAVCKKFKITDCVFELNDDAVSKQTRCKAYEMPIHGRSAQTFWQEVFGHERLSRVDDLIDYIMIYKLSFSKFLGFHRTWYSLKYKYCSLLTTLA